MGKIEDIAFIEIGHDAWLIWDNEVTKLRVQGVCFISNKQTDQRNGGINVYYKLESLTNGDFYGPGEGRFFRSHRVFPTKRDLLESLA